jgi:hypothetical protein
MHHNNVLIACLVFGFATSHIAIATFLQKTTAMQAKTMEHIQHTLIYGPFL